MNRPAWPFSIAHGIWLVAVTAGQLAGSHDLLAEDARHPSVVQLTGSGQSVDIDLVLLCPEGSVTEPQFQDLKTSKVFSISDPRLRAIAEKTCGPNVEAAENVTVSVTNSRPMPIYVAFTQYATVSPGMITWDSNCTVSNNQVAIAPGQTCQASVPTTVGPSRFCAFLTQVQSGTVPDCNNAQAHNQTIIETNFTTNTSNNNPCFNGPPCVWYDISVIPSSCTDQAWAANQCEGTGGASYNLPVMLACNNEPNYLCRGPKSGKYGTAMYPSNCGNPNATCVPPASGAAAPLCDNAYFHPTPVPSPNAVCLSGQTLAITFLSGS
jgi:hypothetical protein